MAVPFFVVGITPWHGSGFDLHIGAHTAGSCQCQRAAQQPMCARRVAAIVRHLRAALPKTRLVLLAVTARGVRTGVGSGRGPVPWPNDCTAVSGLLQPLHGQPPEAAAQQVVSHQLQITVRRMAFPTRQLHLCQRTAVCSRHANTV